MKNHNLTPIGAAGLLKVAIAPNHTPKIPSLALKPGTGTALVTAVPANLPVPTAQPKNPVKMCAEEVAFLCLRHHPARLNSWQASVLLGVTEDDIRLLIKAGVIQPLNQRPHTTNYFALVYILSVRESPEMMELITTTLNSVWQAKNDARVNAR